MKDIKECLKSTSLDEIKREIDERKDLRAQMVGQLYPAMLTDEISQLTSHYTAVYRFVKHNMDHIRKQEEEWKPTQPPM